MKTILVPINVKSEEIIQIDFLHVVYIISLF